MARLEDRLGVDGSGRRLEPLPRDRLLRHRSSPPSPDLQVEPTLRTPHPAFTESAANPRRRLSAARVTRVAERVRLARDGRAPNGAGRVPVGEPEPTELVVWHEFLDQRKELSLLKPDVCVKQLPRGSQRLSIDDAGRHGDFEFASEPLELHVL